MTSIVPVLSRKNKVTQKCIIPERLFENTDFKIKDYVTIQTSVKQYICQLFMTKLPLNCILVDDTVTSENFRVSDNFSHCECTNILDGITAINSDTFNRITVKLVLAYKEHIIHCDKTVYEVVIQKLLKNFVIKKDFTINCSGLKFAKCFHIDSISVCETFPETQQYGKLLKSSKVYIIDAKTVEQIFIIKEYKYIKLGGINDICNMLKLNLTEIATRVLVTGPTGCGKSSFVKWFCANMDCFFEIVDGLQITDLTFHKCQVIQRKFSNYLKLFPNSNCVLFIDHLDILSPYDIKQKSLMCASLLVNMIHHLKDMHVFVIAAAVQRNNINSKVSSIFDREVNIGIPSIKQRKEILKCLTSSIICDIDYDKIVQMTPGFVSHDLSSLIQEAINMKRKIADTEEVKLTMDDVERAIINISPLVLKTSVWNIKVKPIYWKDIGGMFKIKQRLQMCIEWPLHNPEIFKKVDLPCPRGVLLFGPPGCCKTTLARGLATECNANFFAANPAQVYSPYVGESEKNIAELFFQARLCAPSIIFLDELDSLVGQRKLDKKSQGIGEKVLSALLNEMDGFGTKIQFQSTLNMQKLLKSNKDLNDHTDMMKYHSSDDVIVVAATNRPDLIDDALLRPGRFDIILYVPPPNTEERESILHTLTKDMPIKCVDMKNITESTHLFSGADLKNLCNEAAMNALRKDMSSLYITEENFKDALKKIKPSITRQQIQMYEKLSSKYGTVIK